MSSYREMKDDLLSRLGGQAYEVNDPPVYRRVYQFTLFRRRWMVSYTKAYAVKRVVRMLSVGVAHGR